MERAREPVAWQEKTICTFLGRLWPGRSRSSCRFRRTPTGRGRTCGQATRGRPRTSCWCGMAAVRARIRGRLGAAPQPAAPSNGTGGRALITGDQTVSTAGGAPMVGRQCRLTGSGFLGVQSSITASRTGEVRQAGAVIRRLRAAQSVRRGCRPSHPASTRGSLSASRYRGS